MFLALSSRTKQVIRFGLAEGASGGATTLKYGTRSGGVWSFTTKVTSDEPLARPVCDPSIQGQVFLMRIIDYTSFDDQDVDSYVFYTGDSLTESSFVDQSVPTLRSTPEVVEYFDAPDMQNVSWTVGLTDAVEGDTIIFTGIARANVTVTATLGGVSMTLDEKLYSSPQAQFTFSVAYTSGMGTTLALNSTGTPSYQKGLLSIISKEVTYQAGGTGPSFLDGDVIVGVSHTAGDATATHTYTPDVKQSHVLHGSNTVISLASGVATADGTGGIVHGGTGLNSETKYLAVYR